MGFAQRRRATGWKGHAGQRDGGRNARIFSCAAVALVIGGVFALALMLLPLVSTTSGLGRGASLPMRTMPARVGDAVVDPATVRGGGGTEAGIDRRRQRLELCEVSAPGSVRTRQTHRAAFPSGYFVVSSPSPQSAPPPDEEKESASSSSSSRNRTSSVSGDDWDGRYLSGEDATGRYLPVTVFGVEHADAARCQDFDNRGGVSHGSDYTCVSLLAFVGDEREDNRTFGTTRAGCSVHMTRVTRKKLIGYTLRPRRFD